MQQQDICISQTKVYECLKDNGVFIGRYTLTSVDPEDRGKHRKAEELLRFIERTNRSVDYKKYEAGSTAASPL